MSPKKCRGRIVRRGLSNLITGVGDVGELVRRLAMERREEGVKPVESGVRGGGGRRGGGV